MFNKTKFPGKPSKLVNKKRVSVLSFDNNFDKRTNDHSESDGEKNLASPQQHEHGYQTETTTTAAAKQSSTEESEEKSKPVMTTAPTTSKSIATTGMNIADKSENDANCDKTEDENRNHKKRVTFRLTLETSDQCKVKRVYNPNFDGTLVSIIKKESLKYPILVYKSNCIVRPSRLTEIVKNSANNIDKLNSLKFGREYANQQQQSTSGDEREKEKLSALSPTSSASCSNVIVASKFNLPKLSANSSRVIKPNKRFLFDTGDDSGANKKKVIKPSFWGAGGEQTSAKDKKSFGFNFVEELDVLTKKDKGRKENVKSPEPSNASASSSTAAVTAAAVASTSSILRRPVLQLSTTFGLFGSPKDAIKSPFSLKLNSSNSSNHSSSIFTTSLVCHVCNSITTRKQPKKYGAVCCDLCKKFMSKMIMKVNRNPGCSFPCDKGDGTCIIAPSTIKSHKSLKAPKLDLKTISKGRCYACWLKKCLLNFQLPSPLKARLNNVLPKLFADATKPLVIASDNSNIFMNSLKFPSSFKLGSNPLASNNFTFGSKPDIKPSVEALKNTFGVEKPLQVEIPKETPVEIKKSPKSPTASPKGSPKAEKKTENPTSPSTSQTLAQAIIPANVASSDALRQRILLKGPRVKHVCRSASLVLGQPIAIFAGEDESQVVENPEDPTLDENSEKENLAFVDKENIEKLKSTKGVSEEQLKPTRSESESIAAKPVKSSAKESIESENADDGVNVQLQVVRKYETFDISKPITRKVTRPNLTLSQTQSANRISTKPVPPSKRLLFNQLPKNKNLPPMISIDFWENYDPAEVSRTGFGLILSEKTPIKSLCFLCGSCGSDPLIFCVCCCEPYHYYCVEDEFNIRFRVNNFTNTTLNSIKNDSIDNMNISSDSGALVDRGYEMPLTKRLNWLCPRCTVCYTCNMSTGAKVKCQKCEKNYHTTCLGTSKRLLGADRPLICASCLKCKSCGTTNVTKFIGNLPMCSNCFRLRQKGNFCPLCQKCYENNDYDVKMMECGDCRRWVHSKCEGLTEEQYNLLSVLPEHIEFVCKKCSPGNAVANVWRESVESEFRTSLLSVIKLLSKSRHACVLLRLSPRKKNSHCACITSIKSECPTNFNLLFDSLKTEDSSASLESPSQCNCHNVQMDLLKPSINSIKQNIQDSRYSSLQAFNYDMNKILTDAQSEDLVITYNEIISEIFPWYQNETKACTDALEETMNDHSKSDLLEDLMIETENGDYFMMPTFHLPESISKEGVISQRIFFHGKDTRNCMLCKKEGECPSDEEGRLLYCGHNTWVHTNCALWSAEVYEEIDGSLQNIHSAIARGRLMKCGKCGLKGATVGCNFKNCGEQYHFQCARTICEFGVDKRVFCPQHVSRIEDTRQLETNFEVNRSVYVELDRKKKKSIEASKVQFLIGSLCVTKLGRIVPILSDAGDFLVPIDFECSRLYWSSRQPWNIVEYKIKISIQRSSYHTLIADKGINFTVDHSRSHHMIQKNLKQISTFHNSISKDHEMIVQEETQDEEPQNNNDLLPPEIKAAIFEDLPHDVLDGISMFDIFPKDPSDSKAVFYNPVSDEDEENSKSNHVNGDADSYSDLNGFLTSIQSDFASDYNFARKVSNDDPESKRRKLNTPDSNDSNNNQGSKGEEKAGSGSGTQKFLTQSSGGSSATNEKDTKIPQLDGLNDDIFQSDGPVACDRCHCTYRNRTSYDRHHATCEIIQNTTESDSEAQDGNHVYHLSNTTTTSQQSITGMGNNNVISMINQQQNQSMATSIPIVINPFGQSNTNQNGITLSNGTVQIPNLQNLSLSIGSDGNLCQNVIVDQQGQQIYAQPLQLSQFGQGATLMPIRNFNQGNVINNGNISYINTSQQQPTQYIQLAPSNGGSSNTQQLMTITSQQSNDHDQQKIQKKPLLLPSPTKGKNKTSSNMQLMNGKKKIETMSSKSQQQISIMNSKNIQIANYQTSSSPRSSQQNTIQQPTQQNIIFQQQAQQQQYPLILNQNGQLVQYIPTDNQNGSQIQYLSQINGTSSKDGKNSSQNFITNAQQSSSPQIFQNAFQLPSNNTGNLVLTPNGLSVLPVQSPIMGTLIQQPQGLQCVNGVMSGDQMMLGSTPAIEMDPTSGCMYLTTQPVYYGLETIVQNTVMSSQQFVSTAAMQGICQNSSFSATTTQVFQASKIEPIQMEIPTGYVFLNSNDGSIHQPLMESAWNVVDEKKPVEIGTYNSQKMQNVIMKSSPVMNQKAKVQTKVNKIQPQIVSKTIPTSSSSINNTASHTVSTVLKTVNENPPKQQHNVHIFNQNLISKKQKATYRTIGPKIPQEEVNKVPTSAAFIKPKVQAKPIQVNNFQSISIKPAVVSTPVVQTSARVELETTPKVTLDQTYRNVQNNIIANNKAKLESSTSNIQTTVINLPTNVVNPIQQSNSIFNNLNSKNQNSIKPHFQNRPTNRVLPMQASSGTSITVKNSKIGNIAKGNNQNGTSGNAGSNNTSLRNTSSPLVNHHNSINNNSVMPPVQSEISEIYCEKIKSIAMELQSSKADELFDALRRSTINNVITVTPNEFFVEKSDKKLKSSSPPRIDNFQIPSTSASNLTSNYIKTPTVTKTASVCSLTKTIDSVATGANLLDDRPDSPALITDMLPPSITITPLETPIEKSMPILEKMNIETIFEELPDLKASKESVSEVSEEISPDEEPEELKAPEKSSFQAFDEDTSSERPSTSTGSSYATKSSREKTPTNSTNSKVCGPKILFEIQSQDGFTYKSNSISEIWEKLFETVQLARKAHGLMPLPEGRLNEMTGDQLLGLKTNALKYLLEQLPGVEKCARYSPKYHRGSSSSASTASSTSSFSSMNGNCSSMSGLYGSSSFSSNASNLSSNSSISTSLTSLNQYMSEADEILYESIYGCAKLEPFSARSEYDMFSWLASRHRLAPMPVHLQSNNDEVILRRGTGSNLPMAMKYRTLKESYKKSVGVYRSHIHGRGLFCTRDIEAGEMVIEYAGELIRSTLTDKRERYYDSKGIGCYMFKIDDNLVVDATMSGTAARFINHSCDPNCYSKVVDILGQKHIIIFALRRIVTGEELTYDYKFDIEDNKIPCCCAAKRCRKYMN